MSDVAGTNHALEEEPNELGVHSHQRCHGGRTAVQVDEPKLRKEGEGGKGRRKGGRKRGRNRASRRKKGGRKKGGREKRKKLRYIRIFFTLRKINKARQLT